MDDLRDAGAPAMEEYQNSPEVDALSLIGRTHIFEMALLKDPSLVRTMTTRTFPSVPGNISATRPNCHRCGGKLSSLTRTIVPILILSRCFIHFVRL